MLKSQLRKTAYEYIRTQLGNLHGLSLSDGQQTVVPLSELMLLKEGLADPSAELVASLKQLLKCSVTEVEIDAHLVTPFQPCRCDNKEER
jgi:hypothetical protein